MKYSKKVKKSQNFLRFNVITCGPYRKNLRKSPLPPAKKGSRQRALCHLPRKAVGKGLFATCQEMQSAKSSVISQRRSFSLPTAFLLAGGKGFFADRIFAGCSLPTATCKTVGKAFATCFRAFADCFRQSAKNGIPVVYTSNKFIIKIYSTINKVHKYFRAES